MTVQAAIIQRDIRNIRACKSLAELAGYEAWARRTRGLDQHEVTAIAEMRRKLEGRK